MEKKTFLPFTLILIGSAFLIISILLIVFKSNRKLIAQKFKLGGIILTITGSITTSLPSCMCYAPEPPQPFDYISLNTSNFNYDSNYYEFDKIMDSIHGEIAYRVSDSFSYQIIDSNEVIFQGSNLSALDGTFDTKNEDFSIPIIDTLSVGKYSIQFYNKEYNKVKIDPEGYNVSFNLFIK
ncbi:MAG: hypothetical protein HOG05_15055 [Bacteroidetes bacterium]|jgi:hypothetical protein|nr:hypothetical protein [Bacteroidota bacterium]MBT5530790.1 hypothetical protein [Cytophagia bacterium]MBT3422461.1 hypothetical protein [Bacteroidota bacterium]MBT3802466.1 hypothetical protein [Bacteroidota bacterium]MBT3935908.1 hypothetical protein [Bacteroidota bacterium]